MALGDNTRIVVLVIMSTFWLSEHSYVAQGCGEGKLLNSLNLFQDTVKRGADTLERQRQGMGGALTLHSCSGSASEAGPKLR